jgi:magnesium and cobalt transporter
MANSVFDTVGAGLAWVRNFIGLSDPDWRESITDVLTEASDGSSDLSSEEHHMLRNLLGFRDVRVEDVMVPRADITGVEEQISYEDLLACFVDCAHSRVPVYRETLDHPIGMVHMKDILPLVHNGTAGFSLARIVRDVLFAPPSMPALDLLLRMQSTRTHMALVVDEYGGTDGLVTIEDLVEEIVGEIEDEHDDDPDDPVLVFKREHHWEASARLDIDDLRRELGVDFDMKDFEEVDTLGGLAFTLAGRVPQRGEILNVSLADGRVMELLIRDVDPRRIKSLELKLRQNPDTAD